MLEIAGTQAIAVTQPIAVTQATAIKSATSNTWNESSNRSANKVETQSWKVCKGSESEEKSASVEKSATCSWDTRCRMPDARNVRNSMVASS